MMKRRIDIEDIIAPDNVRKLVAYARTNPNDAANQFRSQPQDVPMSGIHDEGEAPARNAEETAI
jgi:hypothetical protein